MQGQHLGFGHVDCGVRMKRGTAYGILAKMEQSRPIVNRINGHLKALCDFSVMDTAMLIMDQDPNHPLWRDANMDYMRFCLGMRQS